MVGIAVVAAQEDGIGLSCFAPVVLQLSGDYAASGGQFICGKRWARCLPSGLDMMFAINHFQVSPEAPSSDKIFDLCSKMVT